MGTALSVHCSGSTVFSVQRLVNGEPFVQAYCFLYKGFGEGEMFSVVVGADMAGRSSTVGSSILAGSSMMLPALLMCVTVSSARMVFPANMDHKDHKAHMDHKHHMNLRSPMARGSMLSLEVSRGNRDTSNHLDANFNPVRPQGLPDGQCGNDLPFCPVFNKPQWGLCWPVLC